ncbi:hypothetical protein K438DRAFT_1780253 [Mycena galopus ATCC 62051]|nr:hypothetical protein K438DRAFT_1780253 [Mycena galopus ATCC 62051]
MPITRLPYVQHRGVETRPGSVLTLAATEDGAILASSGLQGTQLWNVADMSVLLRPSSTGVRDATVVVIWPFQANEAQDVLYSSTQNGYFFGWRQKDGVFEETFVIQMADPGKITAMVFDSTNNCLCLSSRKDIVQSWKIAKDPQTGKIQDRDIIVLGLHNSGPICTIHGRTGELASQWVVGGRIGDAAFNWKDGVFCLDDPMSGPSLFRFSDQTKTRTYEIEHIRKNNRPRNICFGDQGSTLICSSDQGCVYVFDTCSGEKLVALSVGTTEWVQVIATAEIDGIPVIFGAQTRALDFSEEIFVWKRAQPARKASTGRDQTTLIMKALVVLGCMAFVYQNVGTKMIEWYRTIEVY